MTVYISAYNSSNKAQLINLNSAPRVRENHQRDEKFNAFVYFFDGTMIQNKSKKSIFSKGLNN